MTSHSRVASELRGLSRSPLTSSGTSSRLESLSKWSKYMALSSLPISVSQEIVATHDLIRLPVAWRYEGLDFAPRSDRVHRMGSSPLRMAPNHVFS